MQNPLQVVVVFNLLDILEVRRRQLDTEARFQFPERRSIADLRSFGNELYRIPFVLATRAAEAVGVPFVEVENQGR